MAMSMDSQPGVVAADELGNGPAADVDAALGPDPHPEIEEPEGRAMEKIDRFLRIAFPGEQDVKTGPDIGPPKIRRAILGDVSPQQERLDTLLDKPAGFFIPGANPVQVRKGGNQHFQARLRVLIQS